MVKAYFIDSPLHTFVGRSTRGPRLPTYPCILETSSCNPCTHLLLLRSGAHGKLSTSRRAARAQLLQRVADDEVLQDLRHDPRRRQLVLSEALRLPAERAGDRRRDHGAAPVQLRFLAGHGLRRPTRLRSQPAPRCRSPVDPIQAAHPMSSKQALDELVDLAAALTMSLEYVGDPASSPQDERAALADARDCAAQLLSAIGALDGRRRGGTRAAPRARRTRRTVH
jgi:hypothetical protein